MEWIECGDHGRRGNDIDHAQDRQRGEPEHHDRPEQRTDPGRALFLEHEEQEQHGQGERNHIGLEGRCRDLQTLHRREYRDRRRHHAVAVEQRRAEQAENQDRIAPQRSFLDRPQRQGHQRHDAAFALVVGTHDEGHILDRDHDHQRPENQREDTQDIVRGNRYRMIRAGEHFLHRIERAGTDVAIDHPKRRQRQRALARALDRIVCTHLCSCCTAIGEIIHLMT